MKLKITKQDRQALKKVIENFGRKKTDEEIFYDLCFCICAPQTTFKSNIKVVNDLKTYGFYSTNSYAIKLAEMHDIVKPVRFYNNKTNYLIEAKKKFSKILKLVKDFQKTNQSNEWKSTANSKMFRQLLVNQVKGFGMKASSHFLRNLGDTRLAIIDTYIIKFLNKWGDKS